MRQQFKIVNCATGGCDILRYKLRSCGSIRDAQGKKGIGVGTVQGYLGIPGAPSIAHLENEKNAYAGSSEDQSRQSPSLRASGSPLVRPPDQSGSDPPTRRGDSALHMQVEEGR